MEKFSNLVRQPKRIVSGRKRVKPYQSMTPMGEAMEARDRGLDEMYARLPRSHSLEILFEDGR
jgi:hypothetical protein